MAVSVVVVEDAESDGRQDAGEVEEERGGEHLLRSLVAEDAVRVVGDVVRETPLQIVVDALPESTAFLLLLQCFNRFINTRIVGGQFNPISSREQVPYYRYLTTIAINS